MLQQDSHLLTNCYSTTIVISKRYLQKIVCLLHFKRICSFFSLNVTEHGGRNKGQALKKDESQEREDDGGELSVLSSWKDPRLWFMVL